MKIEYKNTFWDLFLFYILHQFLTPVFQVFTLLPAVWIFFDSRSLGVSLPLRAIIGVLAYIALWAFQAFFLIVFLVATKKKTILTSHTIYLDTDGLHEKTAFNHTVHFWSGGIVKALRQPGFIAVYVTTLSAHIIPVRAFRTREEADQFLNAVREKLIQTH
jgi:hypothetical protein